MTIFMVECLRSWRPQLEELEVCERLAECFRFLGSEANEREAELVSALAEESEGGFDGHRVGVQGHEGVEQRVVALLDLERFREQGLGRLVLTAYGLPPDEVPPLLNWWSERLPRPHDGT